MAKFLQLVNGIPTSVEVPGTEAAYSESIYYEEGLAESTPITLPNEKSFSSATAKDIIVILNQKVVEEGRDFVVVGEESPYTQISFNYALTDDSVVRFIKSI